MSIKQEETGSVLPKKEASARPASAGPNDADDEEEEDDDLYDANEMLDLDFSRADQKVWLVRLPKMISDKWNDINAIADQEIGKVRVYEKKTPNGGNSMKLILNDIPQFEDIPHEFNLEVTKPVVDNTYVFTEKDLTNEDREKLRAGMSETLQREREEREKERKRRKREMLKRGRWGNWRNQKDDDKLIPYVRTISKKTALVGTVCHECQAMPCRDDSKYRQLIEARKNLDVVAPRAKVTLIEELPGITLSNVGPSLKAKTVGKTAKDKTASRQEHKNVRMPQSELLDLLFRLFEEYDYWSMKGLRERTKQPETYLKSSLDKVAILVKKGPYALKYRLKPEFKKLRDAQVTGNGTIELDSEMPDFDRDSSATTAGQEVVDLEGQSGDEDVVISD